ncbi:MAG: NRDE family protein, partial [Pseudomonadales bacterium]
MAHAALWAQRGEIVTLPLRSNRIPDFSAMCLIAVAYRMLPGWPLLVLANRDEFYARPAAALAPWPDSGLLAGRDLEAGGTWLGIHPRGRFAAVTNVTEAPLDPAPPASRGALVERFLAGDAPSHGYLEALEAEHDAYRGFNLLTFDGETLAYG